MCGIIGFESTGKRPVISTAINMLRKLEYRGYDSAGLAYTDENGIHIYKKKGNIDNLAALLDEQLQSRCDIKSIIGHTRWATHGAPSDINSHPHTDCTGTLTVVHNGIIENFKELREELEARGHVFKSDTDTEVIAHILEETMAEGDIIKGFIEGISRLEGSYAVQVISSSFDGILAAKMDSPLVVGLGKNEVFIASDVTPLVRYTRKVVYLNNGQYIYASGGKVEFFDKSGKFTPSVTYMDISPEAAEKGGYEHFMLKEIYEQPDAIHTSIIGRLIPPYLDINVDSRFFDLHDRILLLACGTSYHAAMVGKYYFEDLLGIPVEVQYASEYRYSSYTLGNPYVIAVSQSGETADTLAALRECRARGYSSLAITNVMGSSITRLADNYILTHAGPEIGVAATKTFTTQVISLLLTALTIGHVTHRIDNETEDLIVSTLRKLPRLCSNVLSSDGMVTAIAEYIAGFENAFFIGRNLNYPVALEGALKLKEISYIHAEGYPAGELKHGPLALLTPESPVIAILDMDHTHEKMLSNIGEVISRGAPVIILAMEGDESPGKYSDMIVQIPRTTRFGSPILYGVIMQMLSYYAARNRGCEIDQPRNLAKSVTVE